jgi:hypothetical protein
VHVEQHTTGPGNALGLNTRSGAQICRRSGVTERGGLRRDRNVRKSMSGRSTMPLRNRLRLRGGPTSSVLEADCETVAPPGLDRCQSISGPSLRILHWLTVMGRTR